LDQWNAAEFFAEVDSNGLHLRVGAKNSPVVATAAERYLKAVRQPFPDLLRKVLSICNGFNVEETSSGSVEVTSEESVRNVWNGLLAAEEIESAETGDGRFSGLKFAIAYAQCPLILVDDRKQRGAVVFDDGKGPPVVVSKTLAGFLEELVAHGLSVEAVVSQHINDADGQDSGSSEQGPSKKPCWRFW
jgi:hypothetical protein